MQDTTNLSTLRITHVDCIVVVVEGDDDQGDDVHGGGVVLTG